MPSSEKVEKLSLMGLSALYCAGDSAARRDRVRSSSVSCSWGMAGKLRLSV